MRKLTEEHRRKLSLSLIGNQRGKGKKGFICSAETRKRMSEGKIKYFKNHFVWNKGKSNIYSFEIRRKISNKLKGARSSSWLGGKTFEKYPVGWTGIFREEIRIRDGYKCRLCNVPQIECFKKLHIHHIDYNKKNIDKDNLISLCNYCHSKTNENRDYWIKFFRPNSGGVKIPQSK